MLGDSVSWAGGAPSPGSTERAGWGDTYKEKALVPVPQRRERHSWVLPPASHYPGARMLDPKPSPSLFQVQRPKVHLSLQATSQQPSPEMRLCFLIKLKSGGDQHQQQSPRGNGAVSSPQIQLPQLLPLFIPASCHH